MDIHTGLFHSRCWVLLRHMDIVRYLLLGSLRPVAPGGIRQVPARAPLSEGAQGREGDLHQYAAWATYFHLPHLYNIREVTLTRPVASIAMGM